MNIFYYLCPVSIDISKAFEDTVLEQFSAPLENTVLPKRTTSYPSRSLYLIGSLALLQFWTVKNSYQARLLLAKSPGI